jgi:ChrB-like protein
VVSHPYGGTVAEVDWVLLAYRLPREPSTPRISMWRKLRRLGAVQLVDGLVALPADSSTVETFDWLADEVLEAGGQAWTWRARPGSRQQSDALRQRISDAVAEEYAALIEEARDADEPSRRTVDRLRRELHSIEARDRYAVKERAHARREVERLARAVDRLEQESVR